MSSSYMRLEDLPPQRPDTWEGVLSFLPRAEVNTDRHPWVGCQGGGISFNELMGWASRFAQERRWSLSKAELGAALHIFQEFRKKTQAPLSKMSCCRRLSSLCILDHEWERIQGLALEIRKIENVLQKTIDLHSYVENQKEKAAEVYVPRHKSDLDRSFHFGPQGQVFVHLNRKKKGDLLIGRGVHKEVTLAQELGTDHLLASGASLAERMGSQEIAFLKEFQDKPGFVKFVDVLSYRNKEYETKYRLFTEYCPEGNLANLFIMNNQLSRADRKSLFISLVESVALIHEMGCLHRDLKAANVLLDRDAKGQLVSKIADFGAMCRKENLAERQLHRSTIMYASPEFTIAQEIADKETRKEKTLEATTEALDSWGLGCLLFALVKIGEPSAESRFASAPFFGAKAVEFEEPAQKNGPEHLVWELLCQRITAQQAKARLAAIEF